MGRIAGILSFMCLSGCWVTPTELADKTGVVDTDTDTDTGLDGLSIVSLAPKMASNGGGDEVEIETTKLGADIEVLLGGRVAQILEVTGNRIRITVPKQETEAWVDVEVKSGGRSAVLEDSFYLWPDGTGLMGAIGVFEYWYEYDILSFEDQERVSSQINFVEPTSFRTREYWAPSLDQCVRDYSPDVGDVTLINTEATEVVLKSGVREVTILQSGASSFFEAELSKDDFIRNARYDLNAMAGASIWPSVDVQGFAETPAGDFTVYKPNFGATLPNISRTVELSWDASNPGDVILVYIGRYEGSTLKEVVTCSLRDDGDHIISSSLFSGWSTLSQAYVAMGRATTSTAILPHNGSQSDILGIHWASGLVWMY